MANIIYYVVSVAALVVAYHGPDLPPGPYCGTTGECCQDRQDSCAHQILDTLCYCDQHCNRTHDDCCPDYEQVCLGVKPLWTIAPPEPQIKLDGICTPGQKTMERCNECVCLLNEIGILEWVCEQNDCVIDDEVIALVNQGYSWTATNYTDFYSKKLKDAIVYKLGTLPLSKETERMGAIRYDKDNSYPTHFDARIRWPTYISPIMEQGWCGSDWAVSTASVASDRFAIQSNGAENMILSSQVLLSCSGREQHGCRGGNVDVAWNFVRNFGLVDENCLPYLALQYKCPFKKHATLVDDGCVPHVQKRTSRYKVGPPGRLKAEEDIMYDIMESGPVQALMTVRQDFFHYRSGIYRHTPFGNDLHQGLHSVRIIGWGEEGGDKYWIVANSWGTKWGEDGYFRIARGSNESGIESFVITVLPEVSEA